ncbi:MAG: lipid A biosynthesis acyltransferase [Deltaproteobacteria bacterium]|nr:lipid A biosynthesis acyltransferase [Deltaproteobacteria bacterium]
MTGEGHDAAPSAGWSSAGERGSTLALRFIVGCVRTIGPGPLVILLAPIALYFVTFATEARRASRSYLRRIRHVQGESGEPGLLAVYRHIYSFAAAILDRVALWSSAIDRFDIEIHGREHMQPAIEAHTGAFLIGAHIGSFDVLRVIARDADIPINVLMYSVHAERINQAFKELDPDSNVRIIDLDQTSVNTGLEIRRCIERGEFVAVLADRMRPSARNRVGYANFLGDQAAFPQGPFLLASLLRLPVVLTIALRRGPRRYDIYLEPISDGAPIGPKERPAAIQQQIELYASRLEHYCLEAPLQWFNFYDFWAKADNERG